MEEKIKPVSALENYMLLNLSFLNSLFTSDEGALMRFEVSYRPSPDSWF